MSKRRIELDVAKGLLMLLVVFGHASYVGSAAGVLESAHDLVYTFHMSAFLLISGYLGFVSYSQSGPLLGQFRKMALSIALPYVIFHSTYFLLLYLASTRSGVATNTQASALTLSDFLLATFRHPKGVYWYLYQLLLFFPLLLISWRIAKGRATPFLVLLFGAVAATHLLDNPINPFLPLGAMAALLKAPPEGSWWGAVPVAMILGYFLWIGDPGSFFISLTLTGSMLALFFAMARQWRGRVIYLLGFIGATTMPVYVLHPYILFLFKFPVIKNALLAVDPSGVLHVLLATIVTIPGCLGLLWIAQKMKLDRLLFGRTVNDWRIFTDRWAA